MLEEGFAKPFDVDGAGSFWWLESDRGRCDEEVRGRVADSVGPFDAALFSPPFAGLAGAAFAGVWGQEGRTFVDALLLLLLPSGSGVGALTGEMEGEAGTWTELELPPFISEENRARR